jgi:hypothetical protein
MLDAPAAPPASAKPPASATPAASAKPSAAPASASMSKPPAKPPLELELLVERDQEPSEGNPLTYRERAYLLPKDGTVPEAEAALRWKLAELQQRLADVPMGKFANLAVFDHRWSDVPDRPPVVALQWRDWRNEIEVDYPAAHVSKDGASGNQASAASQPDERLTQAFESLHELSAFAAPADGLDFATALLADLVPSEGISGCLYDINTNELRFVSLHGPGAEHVQGTAVPPNAGLLGEALKAEDRAIVFSNAPGHDAFDITIDGRPGLEPREQLYRPVQFEGNLLGMLRLTNRRGGSFSREDAAVVDYVARRLAEFLNETRFQRRSQP